METRSPSGARAPRLNPFAFPSDTDFRFVLLIVSVLGASLFMYNMLYWRLPGAPESYSAMVTECTQLMRGDGPRVGLLSPPVPESMEFVAAGQAYAACNARVEVVRAAWIVAGGVGLLVLAGVLYWILPAWKTRRERLVPLGEEDAPEVVSYLADLCREAGLSRPPTFVWNPLDSTVGALAFGRLGRYHVALTGEMVSQFYTDRPAFRAIVLHELAHLRNADVDKAYFSVAIWRAFLLAALLPYVVDMAVHWSADWDYHFNVGWRFVALTVLVYVMRNAVLRAREVYADVRASLWDGPVGALGRVLEALPRPRGWLAGLRVHPDPATRRRALDETDSLFRLGFWDTFAAGLATTVAYANVLSLFQALTTGANLFSAAPLLTAFAYAPLITGVVGIGAWRATFAAQARGQAPRGVWPLGLGLGVGLILGQALSFYSAVSAPRETDWTSDAALLSANLIWVILLLAGLLLFLRWVVAGASVWLKVVAAAPSPRPAYLAGLVIGGGVLAVWLAILFSMRFLLSEPSSGRMILASVAGDASFGEATTVVLLPIWFLLIAAAFLYPDVLILVVLVSLWAFPFAACLWRRRMTTATAASWAYLEAAPKQPVSPDEAPLRPRLALTIGLVGGLVYCALLLAIRLFRITQVPEAERDTDQQRIVFYFATLGLAVLVEGAVAAVAAGRAGRLSALHGLFAAAVAGGLITVGFLGLNLVFGGTADAQFIRQVFTQVMNLGGLLALPTALVASAVAGWLRRPGRRAEAKLQLARAG